MKANLQAVAKALGERVSDVTAVILDRDRHEDIIRECREAGARIRLIHDGDVAGAISVAWRNSGTDVLFGIGGTPEGVIAACALKCLGGSIQGRLWPRNDDERRAALDLGYDLDRVLMIDDLVEGDDVLFSATGISDGELLQGVRYWGDGASTQSLVMRSKSGTVRIIGATHKWTKLMSYSAVRWGEGDTPGASGSRPVPEPSPDVAAPETATGSRFTSWVIGSDGTRAVRPARVRLRTGAQPPSRRRPRVLPRPREGPRRRTRFPSSRSSSRSPAGRRERDASAALPRACSPCSRSWA